MTRLLDGMVERYGALPGGPEAGHVAALKQLWQLAYRESSTLAYADAFRAIMIAFVIATLLVPLLRNVAPSGGAASQARQRRDELTRIRGHPNICFQGVCDGEDESTLHPRVPPPDGRAGARRPSPVAGQLRRRKLSTMPTPSAPDFPFTGTHAAFRFSGS
jgi:hypothetical protein